MGERAYQIIRTRAPPFLQDVWGLDRLKSFMAHPTCPKNSYSGFVGALQELSLTSPNRPMDLWRPGRWAPTMPTCSRPIPSCTSTAPRNPARARSLEAMRCVCFNAWKGRDITAAALGDTADGQRGTLLLDQAEKLNSDKENGNLIGLLADSYKKAGGQRRVVEITKAGRSVLEFSTYGPKAFASTKTLTRT